MQEYQTIPIQDLRDNANPSEQETWRQEGRIEEKKE